MTGRVLLGTQGWNHPSWVGPFYPPGSRNADLLGTYARAFPTVEIDSTFYAIPAEPVVAGWREETPEGFVFSLKVPQEITHEKRFLDVGPRLARFLHRIQGLGDRLGPLLLQLSPDFRSTDATRQLLHTFLETLSREFRWAIEFRRPQWLNPETLDVLRAGNIALALAEGRWIKRGLFLDLAIEPTADFAYVRWSGGARKPAEGNRDLGSWVTAVSTLAERAGTVFGYFGDRFQGHGPESARRMQQAVGIEPVNPDMLREQAELF